MQAGLPVIIQYPEHLTAVPKLRGKNVINARELMHPIITNLLFLLIYCSNIKVHFKLGCTKNVTSREITQK